MDPRSALRLGLAAAALGVLAGPPPAAAAAPAGVPGRIVVRFAPDATAADRTAARNAVDGELVSSLLPGVQVLDVPVGTEAAAAAALRRDDETTWAQPDVVARAQTPPDDPQFPSQWAWNNTGQLAGTPGVDIEALGAWDVTRGFGVLVAVVDTGISFDHPDLGTRALNTAEVAGNGLDDDANGRVDDVDGWDFANADNHPLDDAGHGTAVASVINARANNGKAMAGVAPEAGVLPVKVLGSDGSGSASNVAAGMDYAARRGARIVNVSIGGPRFQGYADVLAAHPDVLFVVAAGNSARDNDVLDQATYPCAEPAPNVVCVGASTNTDILADFSNRGALSVDLLAPGKRVQGHTVTGGVALWSGTSFSSPMTAAVGALVLARTPAASAAELKQALLVSAEVVPGALGATLTGGRLNALRALAVLAPSGSPASPADPIPAPAPPAPAAVLPTPSPAPTPEAAVPPGPITPAAPDATAPPAPATPVAAPPAQRAATPAAAARHGAPALILVSRGGRAGLSVTCRAAHCAAVVRVYFAGPSGSRSAAAASSRALIGSGRATLRRGPDGKVTVALTRQGRNLLAAAGHLRVVLEVRSGHDVVRRAADLRRR